MRRVATFHLPLPLEVVVRLTTAIAEALPGSTIRAEADAENPGIYWQGELPPAASSVDDLPAAGAAQRWVERLGRSENE